MWFPEVNPKKSYQLTNKRTRYEYSKIVQAITGCNHLAQYENKIGNPEVHTPQCTYCNKLGSVENTEHLFTSCDFFAITRLQQFGTHEPLPETLKDIEVDKFVDFMNMINWLPEGTYTPDPGEDMSSNAENNKPP